MSSLVMFRAFRNHKDKWQQANKSIMAFLAGSHLAAHTLQLTEGSELMLPEIFPGVNHIRRLNLRTSSARHELAHAEKNLATMAIPYVLAIHEDYVMTCMQILVDLKLCSKSKKHDSTAKSIHKNLETLGKACYRSETLELYEIVRCLRNDIIHRGGKSGSELRQVLSNITPRAEADWQRRAGKSTTALVDNSENLVLQHGEIISTLAITKLLWRETDAVLRGILSPHDWLQIALKDWESENDITGSNDQRRRQFAGYCRHHFGALSLPADIQEGALNQSGLLLNGDAEGSAS